MTTEVTAKSSIPKGWKLGDIFVKLQGQSNDNSLCPKLANFYLLDCGIIIPTGYIVITNPEGGDHPWISEDAFKLDSTFWTPARLGFHEYSLLPGEEEIITSVNLAFMQWNAPTMVGYMLQVAIDTMVKK